MSSRKISYKWKSLTKQTQNIRKKSRLLKQSKMITQFITNNSHLKFKSQGHKTQMISLALKK